jgi:hypothetical protein
VTRNCDVCQRPFEASRPNAKFCGSTCRKRHSRGPADNHADAPPDPGADASNSLVKATTAELEAAGKLDTMLGQQALALARRMSGEVTGVAALSKELSRVMAAAVANMPGAGSAAVADEVDELRKRRNAKRAAG